MQEMTPRRERPAAVPDLAAAVAAQVAAREAAAAQAVMVPEAAAVAVMAVLAAAVEVEAAEVAAQIEADHSTVASITKKRYQLGRANPTHTQPLLAVSHFSEIRLAPAFALRSLRFAQGQRGRPASRKHLVQ